jgi:hypothetical protein
VLARGGAVGNGHGNAGDSERGEEKKKQSTSVYCSNTTLFLPLFFSKITHNLIWKLQKLAT